MALNQAKYLPNWKEAETHGLASRVGFYDEQSKDMCPCCHQKIHKEQIPLCENTKSLEFLGFGFPLFYMFIRNCLLLLILLIVSNNFISLFISIQDGNNYCNAHPAVVESPSPHHFLSARNLDHFNKAQSGAQGHNDPNLYLSRKCGNLFLMIARTDKAQKDYEIVLRIGSFIIHVLALLYIKDKIIKTWEYYDEMESDLSDYAVIVKNIPNGVTGVKQRLTKFIAQQLDEDKKAFEVHEIILIPDVQRVHHLHHKQEEVLEEYLHSKSIGDTHLDHHINELQKMHHEKHEIVQNTIEKINRDTIEATNAIIIFETQTQKEYFLDQMQSYQQEGKLGKYFNNPQQPVIIEEAPEPREIIYENLQYAHGRVKNIFIGWGLSFLFLVIITIVFYFIQLVKTNNMVSAIQEKEQNPNSSSAATKKTIASIIAWATLLGIVLFNKFVMGNVLHYFTHLEKHDNKAHQDFSFAFKYALGMFFTTALMTIAVQALKFGNYYKHDFGVIEEQTIMFILCAFLVPLIWTINPLQLCHVYKRDHHIGHNDVTQHEANHLMADYHYDMGKKYAELIQMMWFTFLYADLIPIGAFLIFCGFCIYYWVDKYNLLRRSSLEGNISGDLAMKCLFLLDLTLFWRFLGELIFDIQIRDGAKTLTIIFLVLSIVYLLVPWEAFLNLVNSEKFKLNDKLFTNEKRRFENDNYKIYHPIYSEVIKHGHSKGGQFQLNVNELFLHAKNLKQRQSSKGPVSAPVYAPVSAPVSAPVYAPVYAPNPPTLIDNKPRAPSQATGSPVKPQVNFNYK